MGLLLGVDLGTSYFKAGVFTPTGALRGLGRTRVAATAPAPGRCELAVAAFWGTLRTAVAAALAEAGARPADLAGLSYSSQATTFLLLDARDRPLTPLIVWTDRRGAPVEPAVAAFADRAEFARTTGHAGFAAESAVPKLRWFRRERPALWARTARVMTISDYLTFALTGERVGDASTAAFLGLLDLRGGWWPAAFAAFELDPAAFSRPQPPGSPAGRTGTGATEHLGLPAGLPFAVGAIDHHAAALGSGVGRLAPLSLSTGTVLAALGLVDQPGPRPGCYHGPHVGGSGWYRLAFDSEGAGRLEEYQRRAAPDLAVEELLRRAGRAPAERDPHGASVREMLEAVARRHRRLVGLVVEEAWPDRVIATGGGARSPLWLQLIADELGARVVRPASPERACLGAALCAAAAAGLHPSVAAAAAAMVHPDREFAPGDPLPPA